jgi:hypothetical protein
MDNTFVEAVEKLVLKSTEVQEINGEFYSPVQLHRIKEHFKPESLKVNTLSGFLDYIHGNLDKLDFEKEVVIHIVSYNKVMLLSNLDDELSRECYIQAMPLNESKNFENWQNQEQFIINLNSQFVDTPDKKELLQFVSKIVVNDENSVSDDGISQKASLKKGLSGSLTEKKESKSIVKLAPYRTFTEIEQPISEFLFRMKMDSDKMPGLALFESDGNSWKLDAMEKIRQWILDNIKVQTLIIC